MWLVFRGERGGGQDIRGGTRVQAARPDRICADRLTARRRAMIPRAAVRRSKS